ncbi:DUF2442 domain-containing protein [Paraburkholderia sp. RL17-337-BIB-A]|uniref:DUF2442 domain-containing protein n=1 Tax=Paraburkholderia sp. RL17-337-BIB-A TaxID=3031636 RepID=UPI0038BA548C
MTPHPVAVNFSVDSFTVELSDGRTLRVPYTVSPKLLTATPEQREAVRLSRSGLHWDQLTRTLASTDCRVTIPSGSFSPG